MSKYDVPLLSLSAKTIIDYVRQIKSHGRNQFRSCCKVAGVFLTNTANDWVLGATL